MKTFALLTGFLLAGCGAANPEFGTYAASISAWVVGNSTGTHAQATATGPLTVSAGAVADQLKLRMASCELIAVKTTANDFTLPSSSSCTIPLGTSVTVDGNATTLGWACLITVSDGVGHFQGSLLEASGHYTGKCGDVPVTDAFTLGGTKQ